MKKRKTSKSRKKQKPARIERRVRVTFFIVAGTKGEIDAVEDVYGYLDSQCYLEEERELPVTGFTYSAIPWPVPPPHPVIPIMGETIFVGHWWQITEEGQKIPYRERVVLFLIDFPAFPEEWKLDEYIVTLKSRIFAIYERRGSPQEEI